MPSTLHAISVGDHNSDGYDDIAVVILTEMKCIQIYIQTAYMA